MPRPSLLPLFMVFAGAVLVGASAIFVRLSELGPLATAFHRAFLALPALWLFVALAERKAGADAVYRDRPKTPREAALLLLGGAFFAGDLAFWHLSLVNTTVANAVLLANCAPIFVALGGWALFGVAVSRRFLAGLALAMGGTIFLLGDTLRFSPENLLGDVYGLVTALFFASYLLSIAQLRATFSTAAIMAWTSLGTALVLLPVALIAESALLATSLAGWLILVALALLSHALGQGLIAFALARLPANITALALMVEPPAAALLAFLFLGEALSPWQAVGGAVILAGIYLAQRKPARPRQTG